MIKTIITFCVKHSISVVMILIGLILASSISLATIQIDFMPKMNERFLLVVSELPGLEAEEMKDMVSIKLEEALSSLKNVKNISSVTREGLSLVSIEMHWKSDIEISAVECREIIDQNYEKLPSNCKKPSVHIFNPNAKECITLAIFPKDGDLEYCRYISDIDIKSRIQRIEGVSSVSIIGGEKSEIKVYIDKKKMEGLSISLNDIAHSLDSTNFEYPAGSIANGKDEFAVKTSLLFSNLNDIEKCNIFKNDSGVIKISDIGKVQHGFENKKSFYLHNNNEIVCAKIYKKQGTSPIRLSKNIQKEILELEKIYGTHFDFKIISDVSEELQESISQLMISLVLGILVASTILIIFFRIWKISLLVSSTIPITIIFTILILSIFGRTMNLISLSGIMIGIGMVVDPATIAIESIATNFKNKDIHERIISALNLITLSSLGSSTSTSCVFLPILFLPNFIGDLFYDMALSVIASIIFSFILSVTYIPAMMTFILNKNENIFCKKISCKKIEKSYEKILLSIFKKKNITAIVLSICISISVLSSFVIKKEILPQTKKEQISANIYFKNGTNIDSLLNDAKSIYEKLKSDKSFTEISISGGIESNDYKMLSRPEVKSEMLQILCHGKDYKTMEKKLRSVFENTECNFEIEEVKNIFEEHLLSYASQTIITGKNLEDVKKNACLSNVAFLPNEEGNNFHYVPDKNACTHFSVPMLEVAETIYNCLEGVLSSFLYVKGREIPIRILLQESDISNKDELLQVNIFNGSGNVPLAALGKFENKVCEKILFRWNKKDAKKIKNIDKNSLNILKKNLGSDILPLQESENANFAKSVCTLLVIVLCLLYCIMGAQFESFKMPLIMFLSIPPAFTGAFLFLFIFNSSLNINSTIALVVLFGSVVNNAILLYESILHEEKILEQTVIKASSSKIETILITTLTSMCTLIPFAIDPLNKNSQSSMALAIIGGLLSSLVITLGLLPKIFYKTLKKTDCLSKVER